MNINTLFYLIRLFIKKIFTSDTTPFVYVALGDSTVEGIGASHPQRAYPSIIHATIQETYKHSTLYNLGKTNARVNDVLNTQLKEAITLKPNLITISIGANDIKKTTRLSHFATDLETILARLQKETTATVVMNNIPDLSLMPAVPKNLRTVSKLQVIRFNKVITVLTKKYAVILVDLFSQTKIYTKHYPEIVYKDGFHPSDFGYALWANSIIFHIKDIVLQTKRQRIHL